MRYLDRSKAIYRIPKLSCSQQAVLLVLADHADDRTHQCFPSLSRIATLARISKRQVAYALSNLETAGWLKRDRRRLNGRLNDTTCYTVLPTALVLGGSAPRALGGSAQVALVTNYLTSAANKAFFATLDQPCSHCGVRRSVADSLCAPCIKSRYRKTHLTNR